MWGILGACFLLFLFAGIPIALVMYMAAALGITAFAGFDPHHPGPAALQRAGQLYQSCGPPVHHLRRHRRQRRDTPGASSM